MLMALASTTRLFTIDKLTGELKASGTLDFETLALTTATIKLETIRT